MARTRGRAAVHHHFARIKGDPGRALLRGAARAGALVIAEEARARCQSDEVRDDIKVKASDKDGRIIAWVEVKGPGAYIGRWLEWGTDPHVISVDESQRGGRSVGRINRLAKEAGGSHSLIIGGQFVGTTVFHPGARPHPFLRPALDAKGGEAVAAAQGYVNARNGRRDASGGDDA